MATPERILVFKAIDDERAYQESRWGPVANEPHGVPGWLAILQETLRRAQLASLGLNGEAAALDEIRQAVAVGVACLEKHGVPERRAMPAADSPAGKSQTAPGKPASVPL